jgi:hypothetical protein
LGGFSAFSSHRPHPEYKEGVEPRPLSEPPPRGIQNVPRPTPLLGARPQGTASLQETCRFSLKQQLDAQRVNSNCRRPRNARPAHEL